MSIINFEKACNLEGFLKKKSPVKFTGYQKRYFMIRESGKMLAYFSRKPKSGDEPKGVLLLNLISKIEVVDDTKFILHYTERSFILRADNPDSQALWVAGLRILNEKAKESQSEAPASSNWKDKKLTEGVAQSVKQEIEELSPSARLSDSSDINMQIMQIKGIWKHLSVLPEKTLKKFVISGFLNKRSKGTVKYFQKRWCILVSGAPLISTIEEETFNESCLPPWLYLNHIYYFKFNTNDDDSEAQGEIPTRLVTIRIKDMSGSRDSGCSFLLDLGTRIFHMNADTEDDMNRWTRAIETSKENAQDVTSSITGRPKYIKKLVQLFDTHGQAGIRAKVLEKFKEKIAVFQQKPEDIREMLDELTQLIEDMISTIDGCVSHRPQRLDIAEVYAQVFHKKLCEIIAAVWKEMAASITTENLLKLIVWTNQYDAQLKGIGISDQRISNGIIVLSIEFALKFYENAARGLFECLHSVAKGEICIDRNTNTYIAGYAELCALIEPVFIEIQSCNSTQFAEKALEVVRQVVLCYKNAVTEICERNLNVPLTCIGGFCNDTVLIIERFKTWQIMAKSNLEVQLINTHLQARVISKEILQLEQIVKSFFAYTLLERINESFELPFHELHMEELFPKIVDDLNQIEGFIDKNLMSFVWRSLMEEVIQKYVNCIFSNKKAMKTQSVLLLSETLRSDGSMFMKCFEKKFDKAVVENQLRALKDIVEFLEALPDTIEEACMKVKKTQGQDFDFAVAKSLIDLRTDLDKEEKKQCAIKIKEVLENLKAVTKSSFESENQLSLSKATIEDLDENEGKKSKAQKDGSLRVTQVGTFQSMKGYLQKKNKQKILMWDERFFSIKNDRLYWYKSHKALQPINSISLFDSEIEDSGENPLRFNVKVPSKIIKLLANNAEDKAKWIAALQKPKDTEIHIKLMNEITKESLYEDFNQVSLKKKDLMSVANKLVAEIPRKRLKKPDKPTEEKTIVEENTEEPARGHRNSGSKEKAESDEEPGCCSCFAFLNRQPKGAREPLIIN